MLTASPVTPSAIADAPIRPFRHPPSLLRPPAASRATANATSAAPLGKPAPPVWPNSATPVAACRLCFASGEEARLEVHHRTYRNFGCELADDLTTLCHDCHVDVTCMQRARKYARSPVMPPDHVPIAPPPPLFDYRPALEIV